MNIQQHRIKHNHKNIRPTHLLYFDTETKTKEVGSETLHRMLISWTCYEKRNGSGQVIQQEWKLFDKPYELQKYISTRVYEKTTLYITGHNVFFDLQVSDFFYYFTKWGWTLDFIYDQGLTYILVIHKEKRKIKIVSSTNYFDTSLKNMGTLLGLPKLDVDFQRSSLTELQTYCKRDVEIVVKMMNDYFSFLDNHDAGNFALTRASQAMNSFKHRFMSSNIMVHNHEQITGHERQAYFGGRTEIFKFGKNREGPYLYLDINSMYPFVMKTFTYPVRVVDFLSNPSIENVKKGLNRYAMIARVAIETEEAVYAVRHNGKVIFPTGKIITSVCTEALKYGLARGHIKKIYTVSVYETAPVFGDYIDYWYPLKDRYKSEGNGIYTRVTKIFLNSLYGKFGQKKSIEDRADLIGESAYKRIENYDPQSGKHWIEYNLFGKRISVYGEESTPHSMVAIPAHVTENARLLLYSIIKQVGRENVIYCDTDSIVIKKSDLPRVLYPLDDHNIGCLSIEAEYQKFDVWGLKHYETDHQLKLKGVPKSAVSIGENLWSYTSFLGQASHMKREVCRYFITKQVTKKTVPAYDKGVITPGGYVLPFHFESPVLSD